MSKFLEIVKINILQTFSFTKNNSSKFKSERRKKSLKTLAVFLVVAYIMGYVFFFTKSLLPAFVMVGKPLYIIAFLFVACSLFVFFSNLFRIKNILFDFKDYDLLMSLPLKRSVVISSKIVSLYIINLLYTLIIMLPGYVAYITVADMPNDLLFFFLLLTIPIIPILASSIIGIILTWLTSFFKNKNIGSYVVNLLIIFIALFVSFKTSTLDDSEIANQSINMINSFSQYYPFTTIFVDLIEAINIVNLLIYFLLPVVLMGVFILIINICYIPLRTRLLRQNVRSDYEVEGYKSNSPLKRLYYKEIKKYFSNSLYVLNTAFGCVLLIIMIISMLVSNNDLLSSISKVGDVKELITSHIFSVLSMICVVSCTTHASISLEGKSLWIMKTIPVSTDVIFLSKILVNLTILVPTVLVGATFFGIYLHLSVENMILLYLLPLAYSVFISVGGLLLNLLFPKFDFDNEIRVIKQSLPVFLAMLIGIIVVIVPFVLLNLQVGFITMLIIVIDIMLVITLHVYGREKFKRL